MPGYWLLKTEPSDYSYDDLEREGGAVWDGVANNLALKHMRHVRPGDRAFLYHTGKERAIVGIAEITSEPYPDPERDDDRLVVFEVKPIRRLDGPVALSRIKDDAEFEGWELVRMPRLSVMPVPNRVWSRILRISRD